MAKGRMKWFKGEGLTSLKQSSALTSPKSIEL